MTSTPTNLVVCLATALAGTTAICADLPEAYHLKRVSDGNSSVSFDCEANSEVSSITCDFTQIIISERVKPRERRQWVESKLKEAREEIHQLSEQGAQPFSEPCARRDEIESQVRERARPDRVAEAQRLLALCDSPSEETFIQYMRDNLVAESQTCLIYTNTWRETLDRVSPTAFGITSKSFGSCQVIEWRSLTRLPDAALWTYSEKMIDVASPDESCQGLKVQETRYEWNGPEPTVQCGRFSFGGF